MRRLLGVLGLLAGAAAFAFGFAGLLGLAERPPEGRVKPPPDLEDFHQLLSRDAILPVYEPRFVSALDAPLVPDELVIGVEIRGRARAYPVGYLNFREMVNDRIGPVPFLVTW